MEETKKPSSAEEEALELGIMIGQRRAFGMVAGRCSAAQAECLRKLRDERLYLKFAPNWPEYCQRYLKMNSRTADRTIALLKKHGPLYFEVAALTGITPAEYARIAPAIQADGIHANGEVIALIPENSQRAMDAIAQLKKETEPPAQTRSIEETVHELEKKAEQLRTALLTAHATCHSSQIERVCQAIFKVKKMFQNLDYDIK